MKHVFYFLLSICFYQGSAQSSGLSCTGMINLSLGLDGTATLPIAAITSYTPGPDETLSFSPNRVFTCADIGTPILLTVTLMRGGLINTCTSTLNVEDKISRPPLTLSVFSNVNVRLGLGRTMALTPEMFLTGPRCTDCTYTISPSSVSCENTGTPVPVTINVSNAFCQQNSAFSTLNVSGGIGCAISMSMRFFRPNRIYYVGDRIPVIVELEQLKKRNNFNNVYAHFFISDNDKLNLKNSRYVGYEKLNANQNQKKTEIKLPRNVGEGQYYLIGVLSESTKTEKAMETANLATLGFNISGQQQGLVLSNSNSAQSLNKMGQDLFIDNFSGGEARIFDMNGQLIKSLKLEKGSSIPVSELQKGILIIQAVDKNGEVHIHKYFND